MIRVSEPALLGNEIEYVNQTLRDNRLSQGPLTERFEKLFAEKYGAEFAVACSNGTSALHLALLALGVGPGDEVLVPDLTYAATAFAVSYTGATPVFIDADETWCLDVEEVKEYVAHSKKPPKAVIPTPLYGQPCDMDDYAWLAKYGVAVVVDGAEAHGARENGRPVGSTGDATAFSMYANKTITGGEYGVVTTNYPEIEKKLRLYRGMGTGQSGRYVHTVVGHNYRVTDLQSAVALGQLENLDLHVAKRVQVAGWYGKHLPDGYRMQPDQSWCEHSRWAMAVVVPPLFDADELAKVLLAKGIETRPFFPPMHTQPCYRDLGSQHADDFPVATFLSKHGILLPLHYNLTEEDVAYVCGCLPRV